MKEYENMNFLKFGARNCLTGKTSCLLVLFISLLVGGPWVSVAQAGTEHDGQLWFPIYNRFYFPEKFRGWFEVNPRFGDNVSEIDQLLLRPAIGYQLTKTFSLWQGYAWVTNYEPRFRDEHRLYQQLSYRRTFDDFSVLSRTRFEQRFIQDAVGTALRAREMIRLDIPFGERQQWGIAIYDEIFINLNTLRRGPESGFDQNRFFIGVRRKWSDYLAMDFGYQNQTINAKGLDRMNHIILIQWFINWWKN